MMTNSTTMSTVAQWCTAGCILLRDTMYVVVCSAVCSSVTTTRQCSVGISVVWDEGEMTSYAHQ